MTIGSKIKELRLAKGLKQKELAKLAGIPTITLQQYERGVTKNPQIDQLKKISVVLNVSVGYLLGATETPDDFSYKNAVHLRDSKDILLTQHEFDGILHCTYLLDDVIKAEVQSAEELLLSTVHKICEMNEFSLSETLIAGTQASQHYPQKIHLIREYLEDSSVILKKMFAQLQEEPERDKEDPEAPAPETK